MSEPLSAFVEEDEDVVVPNRVVNGSSQKASPGEKSYGKDRLRRSSRLEANEARQDCASGGTFAPASMRSQAKEVNESQQDCASGGISARPSTQSQAKVISTLTFPPSAVCMLRLFYMVALI